MDSAFRIQNLELANDTLRAQLAAVEAERDQARAQMKLVNDMDEMLGEGGALERIRVLEDALRLVALCDTALSPEKDTP